MQSDDSRRVAVVTGANRGIGLEVSRQLAARGLRVVLTGRDRAAVDAAVRALRNEQLDVSGGTLDVTSDGSVASFAADVVSRLGRVDVLVNNAAILVSEGATVIDTSIDEFKETFATNLFGSIAVSQALVPGMMARGYGRVVNVSSGAGQLSTMTTYAPAYSISKAALNAFTRQLAATTRGSGVLVNTADPGWARTDMGGPNAPRSVEQGADTIVWLATLPASGPTGGFFSNRREIAW